MPKFPFKSSLSLLSAALLSACSLVKYQPVAGIDTVDLQRGYRFETSRPQHNDEDDTLVVLMFSGGGTRAAALGYGVLEQLHKQQITIGGKKQSLMSNVDVVVGVSGGSVLAAYFALKGEETIPLFYKRFLHQNFQRQVVKQAFSMSNLPRLASPEYGRGDLLQEQFENYLFGKTTFRDLEMNRKGPFAIISATDMGIGERFNFTQEYFDPMCIDLGDLPAPSQLQAPCPWCLHQLRLITTAAIANIHCRFNLSPTAKQVKNSCKPEKNFSSVSKNTATAKTVPTSTLSTAA
jgi:phospholipase, patatin family